MTMNNTDSIKIEIKCSSLSGRPEVIIDGRQLRENSPIYPTLNKVDWPMHFAKAYIQGHLTTKPLHVSFEGPVKWLEEIVAQFRKEDATIELRIDKVKDWNFADIATKLRDICLDRSVKLDSFIDDGSPILNVYMLGSNANATRMLNTLLGSVHIPDIRQTIKATISSSLSDYRLTVHYCGRNKATKDFSELSALGSKKEIEFISLEGTNDASLHVRFIKQKNVSTKDVHCCFFLYETGDDKRLKEALANYSHVFVFYPRVDQKVVRHILYHKGYRYEPYEIESWDNLDNIDIKRWFSSFESFVVPMCYMEILMTCADKSVIEEKKEFQEEEKKIINKITLLKTKLDEATAQLEEWTAIQKIAENKMPFDNLFQRFGEKLKSLSSDCGKNLDFENPINYDSLKEDWKDSVKEFEEGIGKLLQDLKDDLRSYWGKTHQYLGVPFEPSVGIKFPLLVCPNEKDFKVRVEKDRLWQRVEDFIATFPGIEISYRVDREELGCCCKKKHIAYIKKVQELLNTNQFEIRESLASAITKAKQKLTTISENICSKKKYINQLESTISGLNQVLSVNCQNQESIDNCISRLRSFERAYNFNKDCN